MRLLGISGSLRAESHNTRLLRAAAELLPSGVELELFGLEDIPPYNEDMDGAATPHAVRRLREAVSSADAVLVSTPEYNASIPGMLKNAIDWASRPFPGNSFSDKPVLVIGASTGMFGAVWAQAELRKVLTHIGADVIEAELGVGTASEAFDEDGGLREPALSDRLAKQLESLVEAADLEPTPA